MPHCGVQLFRVPSIISKVLFESAEPNKLVLANNCTTQYVEERHHEETGQKLS